jgi:hypothetical protein
MNLTLKSKKTIFLLFIQFYSDDFKALGNPVDLCLNFFV